MSPRPLACGALEPVAQWLEPAEVVRAESVCREWRNRLRHASLHQRTVTITCLRHDDGVAAWLRANLHRVGGLRLCWGPPGLVSPPDFTAGRQSLTSLELLAPSSQDDDSSGSRLAITQLPGLNALSSLVKLRLEGVAAMGSMPPLDACASTLTHLHVQSWDRLEALPHLEACSRLDTLCVRYNAALKEMPRLGRAAAALRVLEVKGCPRLQAAAADACGCQAADLLSCTRLEELRVFRCPGIIDSVIGAVGSLSRLCSLALVFHQADQEAARAARLSLDALSSLTSLHLERYTIGAAEHGVEPSQQQHDAAAAAQQAGGAVSAGPELPSLAGCCRLSSLALVGCCSEMPPQLTSVKDTLEALLIGYLSRCDAINALDGFTRLKKLSLTDCDFVIRLPSLTSCAELQELTLADMGAAPTARIPDLSPCYSLMKLKLSGLSRLWDSLENAVRFAPLGQLTELRLEMKEDDHERSWSKGWAGQQVVRKLLRRCTQLDTLDISPLMNLPAFELSRLTALVELNISSSDMLLSLPDVISGLSSLEELNCSGCSQMRYLENPLVRAVRPLPSELVSLDCSGCTSLRELHPSCGMCTALGRLSLQECYTLQSLPDLSGCVSLWTLDCWLCTGLKTVAALPTAELTYLDFSSCKQLTSLPSLAGSHRLRRLNVSRCDRLKSLPDLSGCSRLSGLHCHGCRSLEHIPASLACCVNLSVADFTGCKALRQGLPVSLTDPPFSLSFHGDGGVDEQPSDEDADDSGDSSSSAALPPPPPAGRAPGLYKAY